MSFLLKCDNTCRTFLGTFTAVYADSFINDCIYAVRNAYSCSRTDLCAAAAGYALTCINNCFSFHIIASEFIIYFRRLLFCDQVTLGYCPEPPVICITADTGLICAISIKEYLNENSLIFWIFLTKKIVTARNKRDIVDNLINNN